MHRALSGTGELAQRAPDREYLDEVAGFFLRVDRHRQSTGKVKSG
jgi:hypothetical protein